jgi:hypothetical protein
MAAANCNTTVDEYTKCVKEELDYAKYLEGQMPICGGQSALQAAYLNGLSRLSSDCITLLTQCQLTFNPGTSGGGQDAGGGG